tara:strand:+ start:75 stop:377 length:303 start_codon:yes stop_codon:yes gene_type:complete
MSYPSRKMMNTWNDFRNKSCECGGDCCSVNEDVKHIPKAKNKLQKLIKDESKFRSHMNEIALIMSKDIVNNDLADDLIKSYKRNVTEFMRDAVRLIKKMK